MVVNRSGELTEQVCGRGGLPAIPAAESRKEQLSVLRALLMAVIPLTAAAMGIAVVWMLPIQRSTRWSLTVALGITGLICAGLWFIGAPVSYEYEGVH